MLLLLFLVVEPCRTSTYLPKIRLVQLVFNPIVMLYQIRPKKKIFENIYLPIESKLQGSSVHQHFANVLIMNPAMIHGLLWELHEIWFEFFVSLFEQQCSNFLHLVLHGEFDLQPEKKTILLLIMFEHKLKIFSTAP